MTIKARYCPKFFLHQINFRYVFSFVYFDQRVRRSVERPAGVDRIVGDGADDSDPYVPGVADA